MPRCLAPMLLVLITTTVSGQTTAWVWSKRDLKEIAAIERTVTAEGQGHRVETAKWIVVTEVSPRFTAELALFMGRFESAFAGLMKGIHDGKKVERKPTVFIYASEEAYKKKFPGGSRGYYQYQNDWSELHVYSFIDEEKERDFKFFYYPILIHEGTHLLTRTYLGQVPNPQWFDEGVATYFQFWNLSAPGKTNLKSRYSRSFYRAVLKEAYLKEPPSLNTLFTVKVWNPDDMGPQAKGHYALAESFIDFMLSSKGGRKVFQRTFQRLLVRAELFSAREIAQLEPAWHAHLRSVTGLSE